MSKAEAERNPRGGHPRAAPDPPSPSTASGDGPTESRPRSLRRWLVWLGIPLLLLLVGTAAVGLWEVRTSTFQARYFSSVARELGYTVEPGPSPSIRFPQEGPFDQRLGYTEIPRFQKAVELAGFSVVEQARVSPRFSQLMDGGLFPIYREKSQGGLRVLDRSGGLFHASPHPARVYTEFDSIPELLWRSLVFIENREFLDPTRPNKNPAVEWDRIARGVVDMGLRALGSDRNVPGGSTLATQAEKFRHSPEGRTSSARAKLQQMASASFRAYLDGEETLDAQKEIVRAYLNSVPLAAQRGHGEVTGTADGLWAWYGTEFEKANRLLRGVGLEGEERGERALVYRQALSLLIAHRRPSYYLADEEGRRDLAELTDQHLALLGREGVIAPDLAAAASSAEVRVLAAAPALPRPPFVELKAANQVRTRLLSLLQVPQLYELDRYDLTVGTSLDMGWQEEVATVLAGMGDEDFLRANGFGDTRLLDRGDPAKVIYSFTLLETTPLGNVMRVQTDNYDGPLNLSESGRLELGSTAKLRTLVTYLEVIEELHGKLSPLPRDSLRAYPVARQDRLSRWVVDYLRDHPEAEIGTVLRAAMQRQYSASPAERFATGGGIQTFNNFDDTYNQRVLSVAEAFRQSVNLPSVRTMRDVVQYFMFRTPLTTASMLEDASDPARMEYLARFADEEGKKFLRQFYRKYQGRAGPELLTGLVEERQLGPQRVAWAFRSVAPEAPLERFDEFLRTHTPYDEMAPEEVETLYRRADPAPHPLQDLGYLARVHPLELWMVKYLLENPQAGLDEILERSAEARQQVYTWLFRTRFRNAQDTRIRTMVELEAFEEIQTRWQRLGYPYGNLVPSYGTAIGSSGDRPLALAELMGIILNGGVRYPVFRVEELHFAEGTPFETRMRRLPQGGERVMSEDVATVLQEALLDVVENGTGRRVRGTILTPEGTPVRIGGKTGTGDNRFRVYGAGGRLVESRAVNRTATFAFFIGDSFFGVITAYVPGQDADVFRFTSALPSQILRILGPQLEGLGGAPPEAGDETAVPDPEQGG